MWVSGQPLTYTDWYQGTPIQPDNRRKNGAESANCAALVNSYQYQWGDEGCNTFKGIICESWQVFNTAFMLLYFTILFHDNVICLCALCVISNCEYILFWF